MNRPHVIRAVINVLLILAALSNLSCRPIRSGTSPDLARLKQEIRARFPMVKGVSTAELATWLEGPTAEQPLLLDVRAAAEFDVSHLPGALTAPTVGQALDLIQARPTTGPVVLYCSVGYRSADLAAQLQGQGLTNLYNLEGSIFQWANEGRPVFRGSKPVKGVHPFDEDWGRLLDRDRWSFPASAE